MISMFLLQLTVLTINHCKYKLHFQDQINKNNFRGPVLYARMGFTDIDDKEHLQEYDIIERIPYPNYSEPAHYHDIALVKLKEKAFLNTYVRPACLYTSSQSPWSNVIAIGWGRIEFGGSDSSVLLRVILELFSQSKCNKVYRADSKTAKLKDGIRDDVMICAGHSEELKDTCQVSFVLLIRSCGAIGYF